MEKNDITELKKVIELSRKEIRDDFLSKKFYVSLIKNVIFFHIEENHPYYFSGLSMLDVAIYLSEYRNRELFKDDNKYDYIRYFKIGENIKGLDSNSIPGFLILDYTNENLEYIKSISREYKIKEIIK